MTVSTVAPITPRNAPRDWQVLRFTDAFADRTGGQTKIKKGEYLPVGTLPVVDQGQEAIGGFTDDPAARCNVPLPCLLFGDHTKAVKYRDKPFALGADGVKVLEPRHDVDARFAWHYLSALPLPKDAGYSRHFKFLKRAWFPLPPLPEQRRIAAILDKADAVRRKRQQTLDLADDFLRSAFLDLFGDPVTNPKGWPIKKLGDIAQKITDGEHLNPSFTQEGMPMVMARNVLEDRVDVLSTKSVRQDLGEGFRRKCDPEKRDLLIVSRGATIGRLCVVDVDTPFCLMGSVILVKPKSSQVESSFLREFLKHPGSQRSLQRTSGSSAQQAIYLKDVKMLDCFLPPLSLQRQFAALDAAVRTLKTTDRLSIDKQTQLSAALQQRAFRGEL